MAGFKRTVTLTYGFVTVLADLLAAKVTDKETELVQLCDGQGSHAPLKPNWDPFCATCGRQVKRAVLVKGQEVTKDNFVVFSADEVSDLKSEADAYKGKLALQASDAVEVESNTLPSGTLYHLAPNPKDAFYGLLREMMLDTPDLAYTGLYTVSTKASLYRVRPLDRAGQISLIAEQLLRPDEVAAPPQFTCADVPQAMRDMALQVARGFVVPFDPLTYRNTYKERLAAAVAEREATGGVGALATVIPMPAAVDPMASMAAQMQAFLATQPASAAPATPAAPATAKPARKRATKKDVA